MDECFSVAPSRTIWHTWSGAGSWKEMPGGGRALATVAYFEDSAGKAVKVITGGWYATSTDHC